MKRNMISLFCYIVCVFLINFVTSSSLLTPPQSALVIAFEDVYDLSLLANTFSDQGIDTSLLIPEHTVNDVYENLIDVELLKLEIPNDRTNNPEVAVLEACKILYTDKKLFESISRIQPTFVVFPALRHDGCLLPFTKSIDSIPVIYTRNSEEELYVFHTTGFALPVHTGRLFSRVRASIAWRSLTSSAENDYVYPALQLAKEHLEGADTNIDNLYSDVRLVLWGADVILRSQFATRTQLFVEIGCHQCRGALPLVTELHKPVIEFRFGVVAVLLDGNYKQLVDELASNLGQGRQGHAVIWKHKTSNDKQLENLFISDNVDRQDLIGYSRTRVLLSHCGDSEVLEAVFHGTPIICFPRNEQESRNAEQVEALSIGNSVKYIGSSSLNMEIANLVKSIHENPNYRENARRASVAIRDRLNPAVDRLIYFMRYIAKTKGENDKFLIPETSTQTLVEDFQFIRGLAIGVMLGLILSIVGVVLSYVLSRKETLRKKGKYIR